MNETKQAVMEDWLREKIACCTSEAARLRMDQRQDEAVMETVRGNVYEIVLTVFGTFRQNTDLFLEKIQQIMDSWQKSLEIAQVHGENKKVSVEQIKLEAANKALDAFRQIREG